MTRWTLRILLCLFLGVVTTVGVAWGTVATVRRPLIPRESWFMSEDTRRGEPGLQILWPRAVYASTGGWIFAKGLGWDVARLTGTRQNSRRLANGIVRFEHDRADMIAAGFPSRAMVGFLAHSRHTEFYDLHVMITRNSLPGPDPNTSSWIGPQRIPLRPILPGFIINTLFYAAIWFVLFFGVGALRRTIRRKRGQCVKCGYDLRGALLPSPSGRGAGGEGQHGCPECGSGR